MKYCLKCQLPIEQEKTFCATCEEKMQQSSSENFIIDKREKETEDGESPKKAE